MRSSSPLTKSTIAFLGDKIVWGQAVTTIRAPIEQVLALLWDSNARNQKKASTLFQEVLEEKNNHNRVDYVVKKGVGTVLHRAFCNRLVWKKECSSSMLLASFPQSIECLSNQPSSSIGIVSTHGKLTYLFKLVSTTISSETNVEFILRLDSGGTLILPKFVMEYILLSNLKRVTDSQQHFQQLRELSDYDGKDGIAIGEVFMLKRIAGNKNQ